MPFITCPVYLPVLTLRSYSGNINKPTWLLCPVAYHTGFDSFHLETYGDATPTLISDLNIVGSSISYYIGSNIYITSDTCSVTFERCIFNQVTVFTQLPSTSIVDCVFIGISGQFYSACAGIAYNNSAYINNNVFYGGDSGILIFGNDSPATLSALILNNIFDGQGVNGKQLIRDYCQYSHSFLYL